MKKQLPTDGITHELAQSVFFQKRGRERPNEGTTERGNDRARERVSNPSTERGNARTFEPANDRTPERFPLPPPVQPSVRSAARPNDRTGVQELSEKTDRYSFEIYPTQKERIEEYLYQHKRKTKEKISASKFIRAAIDYYFETLK